MKTHLVDVIPHFLFLDSVKRSHYRVHTGYAKRFYMVFLKIQPVALNVFSKNSNLRHHTRLALNVFSKTSHLRLISLSITCTQKTPQPPSPFSYNLSSTPTISHRTLSPSLHYQDHTNPTISFGYSYITIPFFSRFYITMPFLL